MLHNTFKINSKSITSEQLQEYSFQLLNSDECFLKDIGAFLLSWTDTSNTIKVHTSGSTGKPKEIQLLKKHMVNSAIATGAFFNCNTKTKALLCLSANYIAGKMMLVRAMVLGWNIHLVPPSKTPLRATDEVFDFAAMVPMQVESSLKDLHKIKQLIIGGAPVSNSLCRQLQNIDTTCYATYGMTETITHIAVKRLNNFIPHMSNDNNASYYYTLPNVLLSQDQRDCLVINAPKVSNEQVVTNDMVKLHSDTSFEWLGRYDNIINSGGVKLFPEQIEEKLSQVIKLPFFISSLPDETLGQKLILVVESMGEASFSKSDLKKVGLSSYQIPKSIYYLPEFVRTVTGKVQRHQTLALLVK